MRLPLPLLAAAVQCAFSLAAHATPVTYSIKAYIVTDPTQAITLTGTTTLDIFNSNPSVTSIILNFANGTTQSGVGTLDQDHGHTVYVGAGNDRFSFTDDLHNYTLNGGTFNLQDVTGLNYVGFVFNGAPAAAVTTPAVASTPEPTSLALLSTGLLGMAFAFRKRMAF